MVHIPWRKLPYVIIARKRYRITRSNAGTRLSRHSGREETPDRASSPPAVRRLTLPYLTDCIEAIVHIREKAGSALLDEFKQDWEQQWIARRGIEIVLRHEYRQISPPHLWEVVQTTLNVWTRSAALNSHGNRPLGWTRYGGN
jgi:hypothetical protein